MSKQDSVNRREFVKTGAAGAALAGVSFITRPERVFGANGRIRVAVVGIRGQGNSHIGQYSRIQDVEVAALVEVDDSITAKRVGEMEQRGLAKPATYTDLRKCLEDKSIDAISIASPNHWHSLQAIWSLQAGKDVYCEKPCSHSFYEGKQLIAAAKKYSKQVIAHGSNSRSGAAVMEAMQKMREGLIGEVYLARGLCIKWRDTIGKAAQEQVPSGVDYNLWTGPAPMKPFTKNRFHYNWHWIWDTGNGDIGNQGIHELDKARWGLGVKWPVKISALGGHFMFDDDQETPNTLCALFEFDGPESSPDGKKKIMEFEVRHWISNNEAEIGTPGFGTEVAAPGAVGVSRQRERKPDTVGNIFYGSKGYLAISVYDAYKTWLGPLQEPGPALRKGGNNWANFIDCVRARTPEKINAPIEEGFISSTLFQLANASYRVGRTLYFDPKTLKVKNDEEANKIFQGFARGWRRGFEIPEKV